MPYHFKITDVELAKQELNASLQEIDVNSTSAIESWCEIKKKTVMMLLAIGIMILSNYWINIWIRLFANK